MSADQNKRSGESRRALFEKESATASQRLANRPCSHVLCEGHSECKIPFDLFGKVANQRSAVQAAIAQSIRPEVKAARQRAGIFNRHGSEVPLPSDELRFNSNPMYQNLPGHSTAQRNPQRQSLSPSRMMPRPYVQTFDRVLESIEADDGDPAHFSKPAESVSAMGTRLADQVNRSVAREISVVSSVGPRHNARPGVSALPSNCPAVTYRTRFPQPAMVIGAAYPPPQFHTAAELGAIWALSSSKRNSKVQFLTDQHKQVLGCLRIHALNGIAAGRYVMWDIHKNIFPVLNYRPKDLESILKRPRSPVYVELRNGGPTGEYISALLVRPARVQACLIQMVGTTNPVPCKHCVHRIFQSDTMERAGMGPFFSCRSATGLSNGSCGNCVYSVASDCNYNSSFGHCVPHEVGTGNYKEDITPANSPTKFILNSAHLIAFASADLPELSSWMDIDA